MLTESETPLAERVTKLEEEMKITKGEIKKVLVDIREMMNNAENPFYGLEIKASKQAEMPEKESENVEEKLPLQEEIIEEPVKDVKDVEEPVEETPELQKEHAFHDIELPRSEAFPETPMPAVKLKHSLITFLRLCRWTELLLKKENGEKFRKILDFYELSGALDTSTKQLLLQISEFCTTTSLDNDIFINLYKLNNILNPDESNPALLTMMVEEKW